MKFGTFQLMQVPPGDDPVKERDLSVQVTRNELAQMVAQDSLGFDAAWLGEHHFGGESASGAMPVLLTAVATRTKRLRVGSAISILPFTDPIRNAEDYAALDIISEGRLDFGIGTGNRAGESMVWGIPFEEVRARFFEALEVILGGWTQDEFSFKGKYYEANHLTLLPKPVQKPHPPLFQAASSPETLDWCAERGITPIPATYNTYDRLQTWQARYRSALEAVGKSPGQIAQLLKAVPYQKLIYVAPTMKEAREKGPAWAANFGRGRRAADVWAAKKFGFEMPDTTFYRRADRNDDEESLVTRKAVWIGDPEAIVDQLHEFKELFGADYMMFWANPGGMPHEEAMRSLRLLSEKVFPKFK